MDTKNIDIGQGGITQFAVLKFISDNSPTIQIMDRFITKNYTKLVPRLSYSRYKYVELLCEHNLIELRDDSKYYLTGEGVSEFNYLKKIVEENNLLDNSGILFNVDQ